MVDLEKGKLKELLEAYENGELELVEVTIQKPIMTTGFKQPKQEFRTYYLVRFGERMENEGKI
jgi:hypothetical protein